MNVCSIKCWLLSTHMKCRWIAFLTPIRGVITLVPNQAPKAKPVMKSTMYCGGRRKTKLNIGSALSISQIINRTESASD